MPVSRTFLVPLVLVLVLLVAAPAAAAAKVPPTHQTESGTIAPWTIPAGQCPGLPAGVSVSGSGQRHRVTTTLTRADGSTTVITNDVVQGTAVDSNGRPRRFLYHNHFTETRPPSGSGLPVQVHMTDTFVLHGPDGGGTLNVGFNWRWTYTPPAPLFPPVDNWEQLSTRGDPLLCDPI
jgi:hypothetical protein